jgi:tetratricopeptide (TPR) repeat protein
MSQILDQPTLEANWYLTKTYIHFLQDELDESEASCTRAEEIAVNIGNLSFQRHARFFKCLMNIKRGHIDQAEKEAKALKIMVQEGMNQKEMRLFHLAYGFVLNEKARLDEAVIEFQKGRSLLSAIDGTEAWFLNAIAQAFYQSQDFDEAQDVLEQAVKDKNLRLLGGYFFSKNVYLIARVLEAKSLNKEAKKYYSEFLSIWKKADKSLPLKQEAQDKLQSL